MAPIRLPVELPLSLSMHQRRTYEQLARSIVQRQLVEFQDHLERTRYMLPSEDPRRWKLLKSRQQIDIYRSKASVHRDVFTPSHQRDPFDHDHPVATPRVSLAKLRCVGTLNGSLEDAMLGSASTTQLAMATRSLYIHDEFIQHEVLHDIKRPTPSEPFEYLGLKWALRSSPVAAIVSKRDLVYVEATGYHTLYRPDGPERIGYIVYHSVELAELPPLTSSGVVRAKYSLCIFVREAAPGLVQVFATISSDPGGQLPSKLAALSAASALIAVSRAMECAMNRKLVWLFKRHLEDGVRSQQSTPTRSSSRGKWWCGQCTRELSSYRRRSACGICQTPVCSRCIYTRKLALGPMARELVVVPMPVCTGCLTIAKNMDNGAQVALEEATPPLDRASTVWLVEAAARCTVEPSSRSNTPSSKSSAEAGFLPLHQDPHQQLHQQHCHARDTTVTVTIDDDSTGSDHTYRDGSQFSSQASTPRSWTSSGQRELESHRMLMVMSKLRAQAEETYSATVSLHTTPRFEAISRE